MGFPIFIHFFSSIFVGKGQNVPRTMKKSKYDNLDEALFKWHNQQQAAGIAVRGVELLDAASKLAVDLGIEDFKSSTGWLWRFRRRHLLANKRICGETASADRAAVEPFQEKFKKICDDEGLLPHQLYNFDETGLYWRALPNNTQASTLVREIPGRKLDKARVSVLFGANADGTHRLKPVLVGKSKKPRALKDHMDSLPVHYYSSSKAWFTAWIFKDAFHKIICPAIRDYQERELKTARQNVRALILLDNAPAHPAAEELVSADGRIKCLFLPPNTTSLIQPMDQGVIQATKMRYRRFFMNEVLVVSEEEGATVDRRGEKTVANLKAYNLKNAMWNLEKAWKQLPPSALSNAWNPLMRGNDDLHEAFEGFADTVRDMTDALTGTGDVTEEDVQDWLTVDEGDPGYALQSTSEIADEILHPDEDEDDIEDDIETGNVTDKISFTDARFYVDKLLQFIDQRPQVPWSQQIYPMLRDILFDCIDNAHNKTRQTTVDSFFRPVTPSSRPPSSSSDSVTPSSSSRPPSVSRFVTTPQTRTVTTPPMDSRITPEPQPVASTSGVTFFRPSTVSSSRPAPIPMLMDSSDEEEVDDPSSF